MYQILQHSFETRYSRGRPPGMPWVTRKWRLASCGLITRRLWNRSCFARTPTIGAPLGSNTP